MPYYKCTFLNEKGNFEKKILFGADKTTLRLNLQDSNKKLLRIRRSLFTDLSKKDISIGGIKNTDFLVFNQKLIILLKAGIPFLKALNIITENHKRGPLKDLLTKAQKDINNGVPISQAFSYSQIPFYKVYCATLLAGEKSGQLNELLEKYNTYLNKIYTFRRNLIKSLTYPIVLLVFMFIIVNIVMAYAIPKFITFYRGMDADLPAVTRRLISVSKFLNANLIYIVGGIIILYLFLKFLEKINKDIIIFDYLKFKLPFLGVIILENAISVFSRTLSILIIGGITVPESITIALETFSNKYFYKKLKVLPDRVKEGKLFSDCLKEHDFIPAIFLEIVKVGEDSGNLKEVLEKNADYFETSIDTKVNTIISLIEPILIVFFGLLVAYMLLSIFIPIFNTARIAR